MFRGNGFVSDKEVAQDKANEKLFEEGLKVFESGGYTALQKFLETHPEAQGIEANEAGIGDARTLIFKIASRIKESNLLVREAEAAGKSAQKSLDNLVDSLSRGNLNPGIGTKPIGSGLSEARARDGARVYFRKIEDTIEILGKSIKDNQQKVINEIHKIFGN